MAELSIPEQYLLRFGKAGDFDRYLLPPSMNIELMEHALEHGTPVTEAQVLEAGRRLWGILTPVEPMPLDAIT